EYRAAHSEVPTVGPAELESQGRGSPIVTCRAKSDEHDFAPLRSVKVGQVRRWGGLTVHSVSPGVCRCGAVFFTCATQLRRRRQVGERKEHPSCSPSAIAARGLRSWWPTSPPLRSMPSSMPQTPRYLAAEASTVRSTTRPVLSCSRSAAP